jgi:hypothetical protein
MFAHGQRDSSVPCRSRNADLGLDPDHRPDRALLGGGGYYRR